MDTPLGDTYTEESAKMDNYLWYVPFNTVWPGEALWRLTLRSKIWRYETRKMKIIICWFCDFIEILANSVSLSAFRNAENAHFPSLSKCRKLILSLFPTPGNAYFPCFETLKVFTSVLCNTKSKTEFANTDLCEIAIEFKQIWWGETRTYSCKKRPKNLKLQSL